MKITSQLNWHPDLLDPTGVRRNKPRQIGQTMVIDKGIGLEEYKDLLMTAGEYIDIIKIGFGTAVLYPFPILQEKINLAKQYQIRIIPGGTFLEVAIQKNRVQSFYYAIVNSGFDGIEVSDGTIELDRHLRNDLIAKGLDMGLIVYTEYGKKLEKEAFLIEELIETVEEDLERGATFVTIEGRESGTSVGLYDEFGKCNDDDLTRVIEYVSTPERIMWETPLKSQQVHFIQRLGPQVNLGNIAPQDVLSLECLRRGLRSDTFKTYVTER